MNNPGINDTLALLACDIAAKVSTIQQLNQVATELTQENSRLSQSVTQLQEEVSGLREQLEGPEPESDDTATGSTT